jgi:hypothetical protein
VFLKPIFMKNVFLFKLLVCNDLARLPWFLVGSSVGPRIFLGLVGKSFWEKWGR